jgi:transcriptional regulator with XRE-family HTH domain
MSATLPWFPAPTASGPLYGARRERGLSRRQLAELSGVALATISRIERGIGGPPHRSTLLALALALGVPVAELQDGSGGGNRIERALDDAGGCAAV